MDNDYFNELMWKYLMKRHLSKDEAFKVVSHIDTATPDYDFLDLFEREEANILKDWETYPDEHVSEWIVEFLGAIVDQADWINLEHRLDTISKLISR